MINIKSVANLNIKSFVNFTGPSEDQLFKEKNIIFGYNGKGKSSFACGLIEEFLKNKDNNSTNFRIFSKNYIKENLLLNEISDETIKGVKANFGESDINIETDISKYNSEIEDTKYLRDEIEKLDLASRNEIGKTQDLLKGKVNIKAKGSDKSLNEIIGLYEKDIESAHKILSNDEELKKITGNDDIELEKVKIDTLVIENVILLSNDELLILKEICATAFDNIKIPSSEIIRWISEGLDFYKDDQSNPNLCKFCGNEIKVDLIKEKIDKFNLNEKQKKSLKLIEIKEKISSNILKIKTLLNNKDNIIANLGKTIEENFLLLSKEIEKLELLSEKVDEKIKHMEDIMIIDENEYIKIFENIDNLVNDMHNLKDKTSSELQIKIDKLSTLLKGSIGLAIIGNSLISSNIKLIEEKKASISKIENNNNLLKNKINDLKNRKSNTSDFAIHMTEVLSSLNFNIKLELIGDDYVLKHTQSKETLSLNDISEGESNLLSLLYFYYELFNDKEQKNFKTEIKLIIMDDPISSVDNINKMYVLEMIKNILKLETPQIFILTHVWEDFCNISYGKKDIDKLDNYTPYRFYEIKKNTNGSYISKTKTNESPYQHLFKEIYEFSRNTDANNMTDCEIYHYPNMMRRVLEEFLSFKAQNSNPTSDNSNVIKFVLRGKSPSNNDNLKLGVLLSVCNILSHKCSKNPSEILSSAKFLMKKIEDTDPLHYNTMKQ